MKPIYKTSFRIFKVNDGKTLVENPIRIDGKGTEPTDMLVITKNISVQEKKSCFPSSGACIVASIEVMGILGIIELSFGKYLLAITNRTFAASIQSHKIWRITQGIAIPLGHIDHPVKVDELDDEQLAKYETDQQLLVSLLRMINSGHLYYSTSYDLTHSLQHNFLKTSKSNTVIDNRYFFNEFLSIPLSNVFSASPWISKVIAGFAGAIDMECVLPIAGKEKEKAYSVVLISRLSHRRLGTRYLRRGLDNEGNPANNVEMEQIVFNHDFSKDDSISSFCQLRGSAPSLWGQELDLSYRPKLHLADVNKETTWSSIKKHYQDLKHQYIGEKSVAVPDLGQVVCVNLLDDSGFEKPLTDVYEKTVKRFNDPKITYESFPVSKWCKKMNYKNMEILVDRVRLPLVNSGWFVASGNVPSLYGPGSLKCSRIQTGITRVSCLDSLDRTNLTCSWFARYVLAYQAQAVTPDIQQTQVLPITGVSPTEVRDGAALVRKALDPGSSDFTNLWADSGDAISILYAGTKALKADVTRTGKRLLLKGSMDDGINALTRYYLNNFSDGDKQDAYDLWTGKINKDSIKQLVAVEGQRKAAYLRHPIIPQNSVSKLLLPRFVVEAVSPALESTADYVRKGRSEKAKHITPEGKATSIAGLVIELMKNYSPARINSPLEFLLAMIFSLYILVIVKVFKIQGQFVINKPKLTLEYSKVTELDE